MENKHNTPLSEAILIPWTTNNKHEKQDKTNENISENNVTSTIENSSKQGVNTFPCNTNGINEVLDAITKPQIIEIVREIKYEYNLSALKNITKDKAYKDINKKILKCKMYNIYLNKILQNPIDIVKKCKEKISGKENNMTDVTSERIYMKFLEKVNDKYLIKKEQNHSKSEYCAIKNIENKIDNMTQEHIMSIIQKLKEDNDIANLKNILYKSEFQDVKYLVKKCEIDDKYFNSLSDKVSQVLKTVSLELTYLKDYATSLELENTYKHQGNINSKNIYNKLLTNESIEIPKTEDKYSYKLSRLGFVDEKIDESINTRYKDNRTILHNEAMNYGRDNYVEILVALIKMGSNTTLKDVYGKTAIDYIPENRINEVYENLQDTLRNWTTDKAVGLRVLKAIIQIEVNKKDNLKNTRRYFAALKKFTKRNIRCKTYDAMKNILGIHIWYDEDSFLKKERENYFLDVIETNTKKIEQAKEFFSQKGLKTNDRKEYKVYKRYLRSIRYLTRENKVIKALLLNDSNKEFNEVIEYIKNLVKSLRYADFTTKEKIENEIEKFFLLYPTQANLSIDNDTKILDMLKEHIETTDKITRKIVEVLIDEVKDSMTDKVDILEEVINQNNKRLLEAIVKTGRTINDYMLNGKLPIELAIRNKNEELVKLLLDLGANTNIRTANGIRIIDLISKQMPNIYNNDEQMGENETVAQIIETRDENIAKKIIQEKGLDIDNELRNAIVAVDLEKTNKIIRLGADTRKIDGLIQFMLKSDLENETYGEEMKKFVSSIDKKVVNELELRNYNELANQYIKSGELKKVEKIFSKNKDVLKWQNEGKLNLLSQMILRVQEKDLDKIVEIVKDNDYIINNIDIAVNKVNHTTPIHYVVEKIKQDKHAIKILQGILPLVKNYDVLDVKSDKGMTALDCAIATNDIKTIAMLYDRNMELKSTSTERSKNIVHLQYALLNNDITGEKLDKMICEIVKIRKEQETDITFEKILNNNDVKEKQSLLHIATYLGKKDIVEHLLNKDNISLNTQDVNGMTPIMYAVLTKNKDIVRMLKNKDKSILLTEDYNKLSAIHYAILINDAEIIDIVLPDKDNIKNMRDEKVRTILHYVVASQRKDILNKIIVKLEDKVNDIVNVKDEDKRTALHYAAISGNKEILLYFLNEQNLNLDLNSRDRLGYRAVDYLLMGKFEFDDSLNENECSMSYIISKMIERINDINEERNVLYSACCNTINPDNAIKTVLMAFTEYENGDLKKPRLNSDKLLCLLMPSYTKKPNKTVLDKALQNDKISLKVLKELIIKCKILENENKRGTLLEKLIEYNKDELAHELGVDALYYKKIEELSPKRLYSILKDETNMTKIKAMLCLPSSLDTREYKLYDYAIAKDRYDWYQEFISNEQKTVDMEKIKEKVIQHNSIRILKMMLNNNVDFNKKKLWKMATNEAREIILMHYENANTQDREVIKAANELNIGMLSRWLKELDKPVNGLLHIAVLKNSRELAKLVIDVYKNKVFDQKDENLKTACERALKSKNMEMITYLIMRGAKIGPIKSSHLTAEEKLLNETILETNKRAEIIKYDMDTFKEKISKLSKEDINKKDIIGNTLLFYAIELNSKEMVEELIHRGANINVRNNNNETPLYIAIKYADKSIAEELIKNNANLKDTIRGKTMLHYAMKRKIKNAKKEIDEKDSVAVRLIEKGVIDLSPSTMNELVRVDKALGNCKMTQLMYNIDNGNIPLAKRLIQAKGIDLTKTDNEGITAFGYAIHKKYDDLTKVIQEKAPNIETKEKIEKDFLGLAEKKTVAIKAAGGLMACLKFVAMRTELGRAVFELFESLALEKVKDFVGEETKEKIENILEKKEDIQQQADDILELKEVQASINLYNVLKERFSQRVGIAAQDIDSEDSDDEIYINYEFNLEEKTSKVKPKQINTEHLKQREFEH